MKEKKILILGGAHAEIPLILAAKQLGYHVITTGNRPDDLGHPYADSYRNADFSDCEAILKLAKDENIDAVCASCNDFAAISASYVAEKMCLPGYDSYETTLLLHHKDRYREFASELGIPTPKAHFAETVDEAQSKISALDFPVMVKPVDLTGGKGMKKVECLSDARSAIKHAFDTSRQQKVVLEEFINGTNHGFSAFVRDGKVVFYFADNEQYYLNPYLVAGASAPTEVDASVLSQLVDQSELVIRKLGLKDGIFHVQYILKNNIPYILEICRRPPGDLYVKFVEYATGVEYSKWIIRAIAGESCDGLELKPVTGCWMRHCIMAPRSGVVEDVIIAAEIQDSIVDKMVWWVPGQRIVNHMVEKLGIIFIRFSDVADMKQKTADMAELVRVKMA